MGYTVPEACKVGAPIVLRMLIDAVARRGVITYGDVARQLSKVMRTNVSWHHSGNVAGAMMERIWSKIPDAPPINALLVGGDRLPSTGVETFIRDYMPGVVFTTLGPNEKRAALVPIYDDIYNYDQWPRVAKRTFGITVKDVDAGEENDGKSTRLGLGGPAESIEHKRLKEFVAASPRSSLLRRELVRARRRSGWRAATRSTCGS